MTVFGNSVAVTMRLPLPEVIVTGTTGTSTIRKKASSSTVPITDSSQVTDHSLILQADIPVVRRTVKKQNANPGERNSHTKPLLRHFYRPVYFYPSFSAKWARSGLHEPASVRKKMAAPGGHVDITIENKYL